jgi:Flp pilus assembly protein TadD
LASGGVLLLAAAVAIAALVAVIGWRNAHRSPALTGVGTAVLAYATALMLNFTAAGSTCLAALLVGVLVAERAEKRAVWVAPTSMAAAFAAVVVMAMSAYAEVPLRQGVDAAARGDVSAAAQAFASASSARFYDRDIDMIAAQSLAQLASSGDTHAATDAEARARRSLARTPDSYDSGVALGVALLSQSRPTAALVPLSRAVRACPHRAPAYVQRAVARAALGQLAGARRDLVKASHLGAKRQARRLLAQLDEG